MQSLRAIFLFLLLASTLSAEFTSDNYQDIRQNLPASNRPFSVEVQGDYFGEAKFDKNCHFDRGRIRYAEADTSVGAVFLYNPPCKEGLAAAGGVGFTLLDWDKNPFFDQDNFRWAHIALIGFSHRLPDWEWKSYVKVNFDLKHFHWTEYITWDLLLWGRYSWNETFGLHFGFLAFTGMKIDKVLPVIGIDWVPECSPWKISLVFPVEMNISYKLGEHWSLVLEERFFFQRHRVGKDNPLSRGLMYYKVLGTEFGLNYDVGDFLHSEVHAGYATGARMRIADRHYIHKITYKIKGAPYVGVEFGAQF